MSMTTPDAAGLAPGQSPGLAPLPWHRFFDSGERVIDDPDLQRARFEQCAHDLLQLLPHRPGLRLLDFGCGDALGAPILFGNGIDLTLFDRAPAVRNRLRLRYVLAPVDVLEPSELHALAPGSFDVVNVHSVLQYVPRPSIPGLLRTWFTLLGPGGNLILSDLLTVKRRLASDALSLIGFGFRRGIFGATLRSLWHAARSSPAGLYRDVGLSRFAPGELEAMLRAAGFRVLPLPRNPGPFTGRIALRAIKPTWSLLPLR